MGKVTKAVTTIAKTIGDNKVKIIKARGERDLTRSKLAEGKAKLATAKKAPKIVGNLAKGVTSSIAAQKAGEANVAKYNAQATSAALEKWNALINQSSTPAEGTGSNNTSVTTGYGDGSTSSTGNPAR